MPNNARILMCPPDYYGVEYEINAWMNRERRVDHQRAVQQWGNLHRILVQLGVEVSLLAPQQGLPDLVFTANAGLVFHQNVYLARFRHSQRQGETHFTERWFRDHDFRVTLLPESSYFEGAGDALFCGDTLLAGYRIRSDARAHQWVGQQLQCRVIPMELVDPHFYHLDTCFCPLAAGCAMYYPAAFDAYGRRAIAGAIKDLIEVSPDEASEFACNAVVVGNTVVTNVGCPRLHNDLRTRGFEPIETPLGEFLKAGGSAKCLTLRLDGEDAAGWRATLQANHDQRSVTP